MFQLTNVIPERIIFVSRGITVYTKCPLKYMWQMFQNTYVVSKLVTYICGT